MQHSCVFERTQRKKHESTIDFFACLVGLPAQIERHYLALDL
jgi:hypothetical protein